tara:strand:- start:51903 stop:52559 length:657 start_codon:yes stop_codon:yes gene_type:complete
MSIGLIGRKIGMTRVFEESGKANPVTVIEIEPNRITQMKTEDNDGYRSVQVTTGSRRASRVTKPMAGHFAKAKTEAGRIVREFRLADGEGEDLQIGGEIKLEMFEVGTMVDVTAEQSKGKGFQGGVKRHNFQMQDATHGNSVSHRALGSTGQCQTPGRVFKGKKMAGQMGAVRRTSQNMLVIRVDAERNLLLVKGGVPGAPGGNVVVKAAVKKTGGKA